MSILICCGIIIMKSLNTHYTFCLLMMKEITIYLLINLRMIHLFNIRVFLTRDGADFVKE